MNPSAADGVNAADQVGVEGSVFEFYRALIALRKSEPLLVSGGFELLGPVESMGEGLPGQSGPSRVWAVRRFGPAGEGSDASSLIAVANFSREAVELSSDVWPEGAEVVLSNVAEGERAGEQKLGGWEFALLKA